MLLAPLTAEEWSSAGRRIYQAGIDGGEATFEASAPAWDDWTAAREGFPALCARSGADLIGWAALSPVSRRAVYRGVGALSIYVDGAHARRGVGTALLRGLIDASEQAGFWTIEAGIFPENRASIALHHACGFRPVGVRERVGQMPDGRWRDVLLLERRSELVGCD